MTNANKPNDDKTKLQVVIAGEVVVLTGEESPEYIQRLARYIDKKMHELSRKKKVVSFNSFTKTLLIAINIADDLFKEIDANEDARLQYARLHTDHETLLDEFELLKSAARVANQKLEEQLGANDRLYNESGVLKAQLAEAALLQEQHRMLQAEIERLKKNNDELSDTSKALSIRLEEQTKMTQGLQGELARANSEIESARRELNDYIDTFANNDASKKVYKFNKK